jgi:uncharacterized protein DUF4242
MALFLIRRDVGDSTQEDIDAATWRAVSCAYNFGRLKWITSYWDVKGQRVFCIYEADDPDQIRLHSRLARIPCDEVTPVRELDPAKFTLPPTDAVAPDRAIDDGR